MSSVIRLRNAFKHTNNKKLENAIDINISIENENIQFECTNKFDPSRKIKQESNGLGNHLIQKRLQLIYPNQHQLKVLNQNDTYQVNLSIED